MLALYCSCTAGGVREPSNASGRYQHDYIAPWTSKRRHAAKARRCGSFLTQKFPNSDWVTHTVTGSKAYEILKWISTVPYTDRHGRISEGRLKGTGEWLFKAFAAATPVLPAILAGAVKLSQLECPNGRNPLRAKGKQLDYG